jgi:hypothetical protein
MEICCLSLLLNLPSYKLVMKFYSVLTLLLLLALSSVTQEAFGGFARTGLLTRTALECIAPTYKLADQGYAYAIIRIYQNSVSPAGVDPDAALSITNAVNADY